MNTKRKKQKNIVMANALARLPIMQLYGLNASNLADTPDKPLWEPRPQNKPQQEAYNHPADRLLYGGAAGGGKSSLLLGVAITQAHRSIIFRREYPQLKALIDDSKDILVDYINQYNSVEKTWKNLPGGRFLEFGAVQHEHSVTKYQGRPHDLIGFDELTHFTRSQFLFLTGWNRSAQGHRCRIIAASNPPTTPEGQWVKDYWAPWLDSGHELYPYPPGELLWFITVGDKDIIVDGPDLIEYEGEEYEPHSRSFIPARLADNPDLANTNYKSVLMAMPEPLRSQMLLGSFEVRADDDIWQCIPTEWVELAFDRWDRLNRDISFDPGSMTVLGADISRGGKDNTVLAARYENYYDNLIVFEGKDIPDGPSAAMQIVNQLKDDAWVHVDAISIGSSVYDFLKDAVNIYPVGGGESADELDQTGNMGFYNTRTLMYWRLREALNPETGVELALPRSNRLRADLCAPKYQLIAATQPQQRLKSKYTPEGEKDGLVGQIKLEPKKEVIKRLGRSTDYGDAVCMAWLNRKVNKQAEQLAQSLSMLS